jgi:hypothetical protein
MDMYLKMLEMPEFVTHLKAAMKKAGIHRIAKLTSLKRSIFRDFPYILALEKYDTDVPFDYAARYRSFRLDLSKACADAREFNFGIVCLLEINPQTGQAYSEKDHETIIAHEVTHVQDLLEYTEAYPSYYDDLSRYGIFTLKSFNDLRPSMEFEVRKLLAIEPHAYQVEYELGTHTIPVPVLWMLKNLECATERGFIQIHIYGDLHSLLQHYQAIFSSQKDEVAEVFKSVINAAGSEYFDSDPYEGIINIMHSVYRALGIPI